VAIPVTALYAGLLGLIYLVLGFHVGSYRGKVGVSILHGDDMELATRIRRHGNFAEYVPLLLVLFAALELGGASAWSLHAMGAALVGARIAHPLGLFLDNAGHPLRVVGAVGTLLVLLIASIMAIVQFFN